MSVLNDNPFEVVDIAEQKEKHDKSILMKQHITHNKIRNVPDEMKKVNSWLWSNQSGAPCNQEGFNVSSKDKSNHMTFEEMIATNKNKYYYTYRLNNDFLIIDLDECIDKNGELREFAKEVIALVEKLNPYIERSKSGKGLHIILNSSKSWKDLKSIVIKLKTKHEKYSDLPIKSGIDMFNNKHAITLTGDVYEGYNPKILGTVNNELKKLYKNLQELSLKDKNKSKRRFENKKINNSVEANDLFDIINNQVSIEDILDKYEIQPNYGSLINCPLPNHSDSTASFMVYSYSNSWYCFGCNKGGDVTALVAALDDTMQLQAARKINELYDLEIDFDLYKTQEYGEWVIEDDEGKVEIDLISLRNHLSEEHFINFTEHKIYMYEEGSYKIQNESKIYKLIEKHMPGIYNNKFKHSRYIKEVYEQLKRNFISFNDFNKDRYTANFKNYRLTFKQGSNECEINEHSPEYLETFQIQGNHTEGLTCPVWDKFINETLPEDQVLLLQEIFGYALINNNTAKKFFGFYGKKDTGKSLTLDVLTKIIGYEHTSAIALQELADKNNKFATSGLYGKLLNVCGDLSDKNIGDTALIKSLTSGNDLIKFEEKGKNSFFGYNTARMYFSFNTLPKVTNKCKAFFDRFIIIPFNNVVPKGKIEPELINMFNLDAVITWAVEGLKRLMNNNFKFSTSVLNDELIKYYIQLDSPVMDYINTNVFVTGDENDSILLKDLLDGFKIFCKYIINDEYGSKMKLTKLVSEIENNYGFKFSKNIMNPETKKPSARGFKGIRFKDEFLNELKKYTIF